MTGRQEQNAKIEQRIRYMMVDAPEILSKYSYSFTDKTSGTKYEYLHHVKEFLEYYKNWDITKLKKSDINRYMEYIRFGKKGKELSSSIRNSKLAAIKHFYEFLVDDGYMDSSPAANINRVRSSEEREIVSMTPVEIRQVEEKLNTESDTSVRNAWRSRDRAIIMLGCTTGLRVSAITAIDKNDVDFDTNTIKVVEKGNKTRIINVGEKTMKAVISWCLLRTMMDFKKEIPTNALFISNQRRRISQKAVRDIVSKYTADLDKHITPHKMRSSCATNLYEATGDIYLVQQVLGHKNIANTMRYAKVSEKRKQEAAKILNDML